MADFGKQQKPTRIPAPTHINRFGNKVASSNRRYNSKINVLSQAQIKRSRSLPLPAADDSGVHMDGETSICHKGQTTTSNTAYTNSIKASKQYALDELKRSIAEMEAELSPNNMDEMLDQPENVPKMTTEMPKQKDGQSKTSPIIKRRIFNRDMGHNIIFAAIVATISYIFWKTV